MVEPSGSVQSSKLGKCNIRIFLVLHSVFTATTLNFLAGLVNGFTSPALVELTQLEDEELRFDTTLSDIFGGSSLIGAVFGAFIGGYVADRWGRKTAIACNAIPFLLGFFIAVITSVIHHAQIFKTLLVISRFITGIGQSWSYVVVSIYISEAMVAKARGLFVTSADVISYSGIVMMLGFGSIPGVRYYHLALIPLAVLLVFMSMVIWIPETPRWLLLQFRDRPRAVAVLKYLKGPAVDVDKKIDNIQSSSLKVKKMPLHRVLKSLFFERENLIPFLVAGIVVIYQQTCGILALLNNIGYIFIQSKSPNPDLTGFLVGLALIPGTLLCCLLVDIVGRKPLLIIGGVGMGIGQTLVGFQFLFSRPRSCDSGNTTEIRIDSYSYEDCSFNLYPLAIASVLLFLLSYSVSVGPICSVLASEYLPLQVRGIANGILWSSNRIIGALIAGTFLTFSKWAGDWTAWWTLSFLNLIAFVAILVFVVETKGKQLEDVPEIFRKRYACLRKT